LKEELQKLGSLVTQERQQVTNDVDLMRSETISQLKGERAIVLAAFQQEREAAFTALRQERIEATRDLQQELSRGLNATDQITRSRMAEVLQQAPKMIDHFFLRSLQVGILLCVFLLVLLILKHVRLTQGSRDRSKPIESIAELKLHQESPPPKRNSTIPRNAA
jgi:hypothetical protein